MNGRPQFSLGGLMLFMFIIAVFFGALHLDISIRNWVRTWNLVPDWLFPWGPWIATAVITAIVANRIGLDPKFFVVLTAILWPLFWFGLRMVCYVLLGTSSTWAAGSAEEQRRWMWVELFHWIERSVAGTIIGLMIEHVIRDHRSFVATIKSGASYLFRSTPVGWIMMIGFLCPTLFLGIDALIGQLSHWLNFDGTANLKSLPKFFIVRSVYAWSRCSLSGLAIGAAVGCLVWALRHYSRTLWLRYFE